MKTDLMNRRFFLKASLAAGGARRLVVFPDGRVMVMGTTDTAEACALAAKVIGC
jgi:hypothetical protein